MRDCGRGEGHFTGLGYALAMVSMALRMSAYQCNLPLIDTPARYAHATGVPFTLLIMTYIEQSL